MDPRAETAIVIVIAIIAVLTIIWLLARRQRTTRLRGRFGQEYGRIMRELGTRRAEAVLLDREKHVYKLSIRGSAADELEQFVTEWRTVETRFVDDPQEAVSQADAWSTASCRRGDTR